MPQQEKSRALMIGRTAQHGTRKLNGGGGTWSGGMHRQFLYSLFLCSCALGNAHVMESVRRESLLSVSVVVVEK